MGDNNNTLTGKAPQYAFWNNKTEVKFRKNIRQLYFITRQYRRTSHRHDIKKFLMVRNMMCRQRAVAVVSEVEADVLLVNATSSAVLWSGPKSSEESSSKARNEENCKLSPGGKSDDII